MSEKKRRRFPTDRQKLHELLTRKESALADLRAEVEELRAAVNEADLAAIHMTAQQYHITPEKFAEIMRRMAEEQAQPAALPAEVISDAMAFSEAEDPEEEPGLS